MRIEYSTKVGLPTQIAPGIWMQLPGVATLTDTPLEGGRFDVVMDIGLTAEGVRATSVKVSAREGGPPVSGTTLRSLRVWDATREIIVMAVRKGHVTSHEGTSQLELGGLNLSDEEAARLRAQGPTDETLRWVATFYNLAAVLGIPPAKQVEANLDLPRTTASKWVRRAREKGLIDGQHREEG